MKNVFFYVVLLLILFCNSAKAQRVTIIDKNSLQPITGVTVSLQGKNTKEWISDDNGGIDLTGVQSTEIIVFSHPLYFSRDISFSEIQSKAFKIELTENVNSMEEIVVSASKFEEKKKDVSQKIQVLRASEIQQMNQSSTADVLSNSGNVFVQKSQLGGGSPIIRGFEANKVLLVVDGIRMNNAIYRGGHLQNVLTLDNAILDRTEIIFGPGSVIYGSDALGGVLSFTTKDPTLSTTKKPVVRGGAYARYMSVVSGYAAHADVSVGGTKFGSLTSFTYSQFGDLRQGAHRNPSVGNFGSRPWYVEQINGKDSVVANSDTNLQVGSGYSQMDFLQKFVFKASDKIKHTLNVQYSTSSNIDRYDRLTQTSGGLPKYAEWYYGPQNRLLASYALQLSKANWYDNARLIIGYQKIQESRMDRKLNNPILNNRYEDLNVLTINMDIAKKIGTHEIRYGIEGWYNTVQSTAFGKNIFTAEETPISTRYASGGSSMYSLSAYINHTWEMRDNFILNDGLRYSYVGLNALFSDTTFYKFPFSDVQQKNGALTGMLGLIYLPSKSTRLNATFSTGYRAPNVDDMSKVFDSSQGNIIVPNESLKPEYTFNGEIGLSHSFENQITAQVNGFYTWYTNALTVADFSFNGQDSILYEGVLSKVQSTTNANRAFLYGLELSLQAPLTNSITAYGSYTITKAQIVTDSIAIPLDHIPPGYGKIGLRVKEKGITAELFSMFSLKKPIEEYNPFGEDNEDYALEDGMPAWYTVNVRLGYQLNKFLSCQVACENILDVNYRAFASNISAPGRNFIITLRGNF
jgi:hemoglobin/transferrin/lactoferrin receptor protein